MVFDVIPAGCKRALDVGCGNGGLTRELHRRGIPEIVGLDRDAPCVQRCRTHPEAGDIKYVVGDLCTADLAPRAFGLVSAVASLHHMDAREGLLRLRSLVAPRGVLVVVGLARPDLPNDLPIEADILIPKMCNTGFDGHASATLVRQELLAILLRLAIESFEAWH